MGFVSKFGLFSLLDNIFEIRFPRDGPGTSKLLRLIAYIIASFH